MKEKNQLITLLLILIWAVLTAVPEHCRAQSLNYGNDGDDNDNDYLLIITSYAHDSKNVSEFTEDFITSSIKLSINLETKIESMGVLSLSNCYEWHSIMKEILHRQNFSKLKFSFLCQRSFTHPSPRRSSRRQSRRSKSGRFSGFPRFRTPSRK